MCPHTATAQARAPPHGRLTTVDAAGWCAAAQVAGGGGFDRSGQWPQPQTLPPPPPPLTAPQSPPGAPGHSPRWASLRTDWQRWLWMVVADRVVVLGGGMWGGAPASPQGRRPFPPPHHTGGEHWPSATRRLRHKSPSGRCRDGEWPKLVVAGRQDSRPGPPPPPALFEAACPSTCSRTTTARGPRELTERTAGSHPLAGAPSPPDSRSVGENAQTRGRIGWERAADMGVQISQIGPARREAVIGPCGSMPRVKHNVGRGRGGGRSVDTRVPPPAAAASRQTPSSSTPRGGGVLDGRAGGACSFAERAQRKLGRGAASRGASTKKQK